MSLIQINSISKKFATETDNLFQDLDLTVEKNDHLGLIGPNGCGKSTLLKIIAGKSSVDSGNVYIPKNLIISYFSQVDTDSTSNEAVLYNQELVNLQNKLSKLEVEMANDLSENKLKELLNEYESTQNKFHLAGAYDYEATLSQILSNLGFDMKLINSPLCKLSGGERARVRLAKLLTINSDIILLDEPSNHLDIDGLNWLANFLKQLNKTMILVSHDRFILNSVCNKIASFEGKKLYSYSGNYEVSLIKQEERKNLLHNTEANLLSKIEYEEKVTQTLLSHRKISSYHSRERVVKKLKEELKELKQAKQNSDKKLYISNIETPDIKHDSKRELLNFKNLNLSFSKNLFTNFSNFINANDKISILGPNGCGKSSLLKIFMGELLADSGSLNIIANPEIAYMGQYVNLGTNENMTVFDYFSSVTSLSEISKIRSRLAQFSFYSDDLLKELSALSGGERQRLYLAHLLEIKPDLIILDEPTNHLDINSRELLEEALNKYTGAILLVSHDRYFIEKICNKYWGFIDNKINNYDSYDNWLKDYDNQKNKKNVGINDLNQSRQVKSISNSSIVDKNKSNQLSPAEKRKKNAQIRKEFNDIEKRIFEIEAYNEEFNQNTNNIDYSAEDYQNLSAALLELENLYNRYYQLSELLENNSDT